MKSFFAVLSFFLFVAGSFGQTAPKQQQLPSFKGTVECEKGEQNKRVVARTDTSQVLGYLNCGEEVMLPTTEVKLSQVDDMLVMEPVSVQTYSLRDGGFYSRIIFRKTGSEAWVNAEVKLLPHQSYEILVLGKVVDHSVCNTHGGYSSTEPSEPHSKGAWIQEPQKARCGRSACVTQRCALSAGTIRAFRSGRSQRPYAGGDRV